MEDWKVTVNCKDTANALRVNSVNISSPRVFSVLPVHVGDIIDEPVEDFSKSLGEYRIFLRSDAVDGHAGLRTEQRRRRSAAGVGLERSP